ncbi:MAG: universal stress protein [Actinomycetota bacterium]|nr:universal stress protein [Actinomycetota bacterium]
MGTGIIVSYDGTSNDDDAIALGKMLAGAGTALALAYVRHSREFDPRREELAQHDAERRLQQGAALLGDPEIPQHIIVSASTGEGLEQLATAEQASVIVFGSDYRTSPGRSEPGATAQRLLEGGPVPIAVASAGLRTRQEKAIESIAVFGTDPEPAATQTAEALAERFGAKLAALGAGGVDLIVVGSQPGSSPGRIALGGSARSELNSARSSALILPSGVPVRL